MSELDNLVADLQRASVLAGPRARAAVSRSARNVRDGARKLAPSGPYTPSYPSSITDDVLMEGDRIIGEIGPDKDRRQGALGNVLEYGTAKHAPQAHLGPALDREIPDFVAAMTKLGGQIL